MNADFEIIIIKPNICSDDKNSSGHFEENAFALLQHDCNLKTYDDLSGMSVILTDYLSKKNYIDQKNVTLDTICSSFEKYINPNNETGRRYEVKTCINNNEEMVMFLYDYSMNRYPNLFNHLATILCPGMESIFGPVFMTKIKKTMKNNKECLEHVNIYVSDIVTLWFSTKQITYWDYEPANGWLLKNMANNNIGLDVSNYVFAHINENIVFFKMNEESAIQKNDDAVFNDNLTNIFKKNDKDELNKYFINIKVCKLKTGEYANEQLKYNPDLIDIKDQIGKIAVNAFEDQGKYQVLMESIFQNASKILTF